MLSKSHLINTAKDTLKLSTFRTCQGLLELCASKDKEQVYILYYKSQHPSELPGSSGHLLLWVGDLSSTYPLGLGELRARLTVLQEG